MLISVLFAWLTVLCAVMTALKFIARVSKSEGLNRFFHKVHIPFGIFFLIFGLFHGIFAGNFSDATLLDFTPAPLLFELNLGTVCYLVGVLLWLTYALRGQIKKFWLAIHRVLTVILIAILVLHLLEYGIQLPALLFGSGDVSNSQTESTVVDVTTETPEATETPAATEMPAQTLQPSEDTESSGVDVLFSGAVLKDGTYEGAAQGYKGTITVSVTVSGGRVTEIYVIDSNDTDRYFSKAENVLDTIVGDQSLEVDAVSGATVSSAGLIKAVYDALSGAVVSGTLNYNNIDTSSISHHGH